MGGGRGRKVDESTFKISACDVISAVYTIIVLKSWVIMPSVKKRKDDFYFFSFNV